ncbi:MAG: helix-turn-helix transcriptional regulator [Erysipelotrichaceae bacterium]|nr:helix-turn-helix transcriptional regulator [Erysipelotrichaceae bacterium]
MQYTLAQLRRQRQLSIEEMAFILGISYESYRKIENEPLQANFDVILKIANILKVEITDIFLSSNIANSNVILGCKSHS